MTEIEKLEQAIAALEAQRNLLGEAVIEAALGPLREKLNASRQSASLMADQRKLLTVLFMEVGGVETLATQLDAEDITQLINQLWSQLDAIIVARGGKVDKHSGQTLMALWGGDQAREDDVERALRAALEIRTAVAEFEVPGGQLTARLGVNTGPVLLGAVGSTSEFTAMGDTVNLASRLEHAAPVGGVLISHNTYRHVRGVFDVTAQPPLLVKGKAESVQTYLVHQPKPLALRTVTRGVEGLETQLVGRAAEMAQLQAAFTAVVEQKVVRAVTVVGEAGLGKSRLMQEFIHWADLGGADWYVFRGRATPSAESTPYALLRDLLAFRFEIQERDSLPATRAKLEQGMLALLPAEPQIQEQAHFIGHLLGWDFSDSPYVRGLLTDAPQIRALALHFLTLFFQAVATTHPVALLLEDVHWADRGSLDALRHVLGNLSPGTPLLAIANARPTLFERDPGWQIAAQTRIDLDPLTPSESASLVADILRQVPALPPELQALIVRQADGNPFYVEELIKMLIDEQVIRVAEPEWQVTTEKLSALRVPPTLTGVLQARLDSLLPDERLLLQRAAVVGRVFWDTAVHTLAADTFDLAQVQHLLNVAQDKELIFRRMASVFAETREYLFKHTLLRDVAYEMVLKRDRPLYHAQVATWLEQMSGSRRREYLPLMAEHYAQAHHPKAAQMLVEAGEAAVLVSAFAEARTFFERALAMRPASASTLDENLSEGALLTKLAEVLFHLSDFAAAQAALQRALQLPQTHAERAATLTLLGELQSDLGHYAEGQATLEEALTLARTLEDQKILASTLYSLGGVYYDVGDLGAAFNYVSECLALAQTLNHTPQILFALNRLGTFYLQTDIAEAHRCFTESYTLAAQVGNRERMMRSLNNLGVIANLRGDLPTAVDDFTRALALAREIGAQASVALYLLNLAESHIRQKDLPAARAGLREGIALARRLGAEPWVVVGVIYFADLISQAGALARGLALLGLAQAQPVFNTENRREVDRILASWALDPAVMEAGLAQGAALNWEATVEALLKSED